MAVLTDITEDDAGALLAAYGLGKLHSLGGIAGGSVNSNFSLESDSGRLFFRLYEERDLSGARSETAMLERLARSGVPTPAPLRRLDGALVSVVRAKPAALFPWREGQMRCQAGVTTDDAQRLGEALARVHIEGAGEECDAGRFAIDGLLRRIDGVASSGDARFSEIVAPLRANLERIEVARDPRLPRGLVHGDLFRDNVLWGPDGEITALLDFESACDGTYAYDLMVAVLAWCFGDVFLPQLAAAVRQGYERIRPLADEEKSALYDEGRFAALRFTVTRITDFAMRSGANGPRVIKDWRRFLMRYETLHAIGPRGLMSALGL